MGTAGGGRPRPEGPWAGIEVRASEVLVIGAGVAGMSAALGCAPRRVTVLTKTRFVDDPAAAADAGLAVGGGGSSAWAQGGLAVAVGAGDSPRLHAADTLAAAGGLADPRAVEVLTGEAPGCVAGLLALGARFDREPATTEDAAAEDSAGGFVAEDSVAEDPAAGSTAGSLALGREAAHSRRRILHACGDATGAELVHALARAVRGETAITVDERAFAADLLLDARGRVAGALALVPAPGGRGHRWRAYLAPAVVLAAGGLGQLYARTTNPPEVTADGLALAARAGARLADLEMVQFHPTALAAGGAGRTLPLVTEAVRGEGAWLIDEGGERFMPTEHPRAELAPRDVVARALYRRTARGETVYLDARRAVGERFPDRFPTVYAACRRAGIDPRREPIPITPAAHYHMGGVETGLDGRTSLPGLWACGEAASTGVHGANRLASNSLLEGLVFGARVAADLGSRLAPVPRVEEVGLPPGTVVSAGAPAGGWAVEAEVDARAIEVRRRLQRTAWRDLGLVRDAGSLAAAEEAIAGLERELDRDLPAGATTPALLETRNLLLAGRSLARAACHRTESRGAHFRSDFPAEDEAWHRRLRWRLEADGALSEVATETAALARERR